MASYCLTLCILSSLLLCNLIGYSAGEEAAAEKSTPSVGEAAKNLGASAQNSASQSIQKNKESLKKVATRVQQSADNFVHPTYDDAPKNIVHSAVSGAADLVREVTGHTGGLVSGLARTIGDFGRNVFDSSRNTMARGVERLRKSRLMPGNNGEQNSNAPDAVSEDQAEAQQQTEGTAKEAEGEEKTADEPKVEEEAKTE